MTSQERKEELSANDHSILTDLCYKQKGFAFPTVLSILGSSYSSNIAESPGWVIMFRYVGSEAPATNAPCPKLLSRGLLLPFLLISYTISWHKPLNQI